MTYDVYPPSPIAGLFHAVGLQITSFFYTERVNLYAGYGSDTINVAKSTAQLTPMALGVSAGSRADTLNVWDFSDPGAPAYTVPSAGPGAGAVDVNTPDFRADFESVAVVNLYVKKTSTVNTDGYNPADYVLNIYLVQPTQPMTPTGNGGHG